VYKYPTENLQLTDADLEQDAVEIQQHQLVAYQLKSKKLHIGKVTVVHATEQLLTVQRWETDSRQGPLRRWRWHQTANVDTVGSDAVVVVELDGDVIAEHCMPQLSTMYSGR